MAYKRLVGVIPVKDGRVVKSYGYRFWRPAGDVVTAMRNLERWQADEILLLDISRRPHIDPQIPSLIKSACISTPLSYGGGIRTVKDVIKLMGAGCERFIIETMIFDNPEGVSSLADIAGAQSLIASVPIVRSGPNLSLNRHYGERFATKPEEIDLELICSRVNQLPVAEVLVTAMNKEGGYGSFDLLGRSLDETGILSQVNKGIIWFGGLSGTIAGRLLRNPQTVAVAFGNINATKELAIPTLRNRIKRAGSAHEVRTPLLR